MPQLSRRDEWIALRQQGWTLVEIGRRYGITPSRVHQVTGTFRMRPKPLPVEPEELQLTTLPREPWTYPDADLLRLAHEARDEIMAAWTKKPRTHTGERGA